MLAKVALAGSASPSPKPYLAGPRPLLSRRHIGVSENSGSETLNPKHQNTGILVRSSPSRTVYKTPKDPYRPPD